MKELVERIFVSASIIFIVIVGLHFTLSKPANTTPKSSTVAVKVPLVSDIDVNKLVALTNQDRATTGVAPLIVDDNLNKSAMDKCTDMVTKNYYSHSDPSGNLWTTILRKYVPYYNGAAENIDVVIQPSSAETVNSIFMNSDVHRGDILNASYTHVGMAVCAGHYKSQPAVYIVEHFDAPYMTPASTTGLVKPLYYPNTSVLLPPCTEPSQLPGIDCQ